MNRSFTLVELLMGVALTTVLTGSVVFIFLQAQGVFVATTAKVEVHQYGRYAFDQMERDLAGVVKSKDMEFFNDRLATGVRGHCDPGEAISIFGTDNRVPAVTGTPADGDGIYNRAFTLRQPSPYGDAEDRLHRRDSLYARIVTEVEGQTRSSLVEYALVDQDSERPRLVKRLWRATGRDPSGRLLINGAASDAPPVVQDLCLYVVDVVFEVFARNRRRSDSGDYYAAGDLVDPPGGIFEGLPNARGWTAPSHMIQTCHDWGWRGGLAPDSGILEPGTDGLPAMFHTEAGFTFSMLKRGDTIFLRDTGTPPAFPAGSYRIKGFLLAGSDPPAPWTPSSPPEALRLELTPPIDTNGRRVERIEWLAPWVPAAVRVTLRVKDAQSRQLRTISRVIKIGTNE